MKSLKLFHYISQGIIVRSIKFLIRYLRFKNLVLIHHPSIRFQRAKLNELFILISCTAFNHGIQITFFLTKFARSSYRSKIENEVIIAATLRRSQCRRGGRILGLMDSKSRRGARYITRIHLRSRLTSPRFITLFRLFFAYIEIPSLLPFSRTVITKFRYII